MPLDPCSRCGSDHPPGPCPEAGAAPGPHVPLPFDLLAGAKVGEYQVTGLLGQGGMGVVYSGIHPLLGRKVAIKVLSQQMARKSEATARFLQEARAASTLHHQNIVDVFAFGELGDGRYYQVMELLEGESLRSILNRRGPLTRRQARVIITGVLSGLAAAHRRGVVHRDIKPDNVFVCGPLDGALAAGDIKILDFGLAKRESAADISIKTRTGVTMGTPAYMSPEQCRGIAAIDGRTDIYAAGVLLFEMIAGRTPFQCESAFDLMVMQINVKPPRLARLTGRAEPFDPVISKALGKRPEERYGSASEMLAAIDAAAPVSAAFDEPRPAAGAGDLDAGPAASPRDFADRATLVAADMGASSPSLLSLKLGVAGGDASAGSPAITERLWRQRRLRPALVAGALVLAIGAAVALRWGGGSGPAPAAPAAAVPAPAPSAAAPLPAPQPAIPSSSSSSSPSPSSPRARAIAARTTKTPASASAAAPAAAAPKPAARHGDGDGDLELPINPYDSR